MGSYNPGISFENGEYAHAYNDQVFGLCKWVCYEVLKQIDRENRAEVCFCGLEMVQKNHVICGIHVEYF